MPVIDSVRGVADLRPLEPLRWKADEIELMGDQVLVEPIEDAQRERFEAMTPSGLLFIPQKAERDKKREVFRRGRVVACGPGDKYGQGKVRNDACGPYIPAIAFSKEFPGGRFPMSVKPGDVVLYERRAGTDVNLNGTTYVVLHEEQHVVAVIE